MFIVLSDIKDEILLSKIDSNLLARRLEADKGVNGTTTHVSKRGAKIDAVLCIESGHVPEVNTAPDDIARAKFGTIHSA